MSIALVGGDSNGESGEGDYLSSDIENATRGGGSDSLAGNGSANFFDAGLGCDTLTGNDGNDTLKSGPGDEENALNSCSNSIAGGNGNDALIDGGATGSGNDSLYGGSGTDTAEYSDRLESVSLTLGASSNGESGESGYISSDAENATGGDDSIFVEDDVNDNQTSCGDGNDSVTADASPFDAVFNCEAVTRNQSQ